MTLFDKIVFAASVGLAVLLLAFMFWFSSAHPVNPDAFSDEAIAERLRGESS